jgi:uncharacterized protein (DUF1501 family)
MFSRRGFIRIGAASVGSLALRPFGLLPALAQSGPNYRALVCVFLYGGNDSNNTIIPMNSYSAYQSIRGSLGLATGALQQVNSVNGAPYGFHTLLTELAGMFTAKELAVVANVGSLVAPLTQAQYQAAQAPSQTISSRMPISSNSGQRRSLKATARPGGEGAWQTMWRPRI